MKNFETQVKAAHVTEGRESLGYCYPILFVALARQPCLSLGSVYGMHEGHIICDVQLHTHVLIKSELPK